MRREDKRFWTQSFPLWKDLYIMNELMFHERETGISGKKLKELEKIVTKISQTCIKAQTNLRTATNQEPTA
jgi:hypothetical protein